MSGIDYKKLTNKLSLLRGVRMSGIDYKKLTNKLSLLRDGEIVEIPNDLIFNAASEGKKTTNTLLDDLSLRMGMEFIQGDGNSTLVRKLDAAQLAQRALKPTLFAVHSEVFMVSGSISTFAIISYDRMVAASVESGLTLPDFAKQLTEAYGVEISQGTRFAEFLVKIKPGLLEINRLKFKIATLKPGCSTKINADYLQERLRKADIHSPILFFDSVRMLYNVEVEVNVDPTTGESTCYITKGKGKTAKPKSKITVVSRSARSRDWGCFE